MRNIIQNVSHTDKQRTIALLRSVWLSYLLSIGTTSAGTLSIVSVAAILGIRPAIANITEPSASLPEQTVEEEPASPTSSESNELSSLAQAPQASVNEEPEKTVEENSQTTALQDLSIKDDTEPVLSQSELEQATFAPTEQAGTRLPVFTPKSSIPVEMFQQNASTELNLASPVLEKPQPKVVVTVPEDTGIPRVGVAAVPDNLLPSVPTGTTTDKDNRLAQFPAEDEPSTILPKAAFSPTEDVPTLYSSTGKASQLEGNYRAQASVEVAQEESSVSQSSPPKNEALTPTLDLQGVYLYQGDSSARARLRGIYPVSPNALFGAVVDLATGEDFAGTEGDGLSLSELYFTGNLPSYPNLRLTAGLMDLTSYFDRNSFAKDSTTHFFHPLFQTNPALASSGIGSRPGALLNWNVTDNVEAKAAVFSSDRSLGDFSLDAFAGEVGFRAGNAIVRATYSSDQDTGRDGVFGTREGDREHAFGINGELYIPQIKMGLFGRYGWLSNSELDETTDTYNLGFNFLDVFRKDDRLGLGYAYGPNFSKNDDVWETFYDMRLSPNFRAGVTLQARDGFDDVVVGFRVKTDLQLYP